MLGCSLGLEQYDTDVKLRSAKVPSGVTAVGQSNLIYVSVRSFQNKNEFWNTVTLKTQASHD